MTDKLTSADCFEAIVLDAQTQSDIFEAMYERRKFLGKYDNWQEFKAKCLREIRDEKKPWTRIHRKKTDQLGVYERCYFVDAILDYYVMVYEENNAIIRIEYTSEEP